MKSKRSLQNLLSLRSDKAALWEIRQLAHALFNALPADHRYLFVDHLKEEV
jgi:thymidylate synthase (FAD)